MIRWTARQDEGWRMLTEGGAKHNMFYGGSRSGKTFLLCGAIAIRADAAPGSRHAIVRQHANAVKTSIGLDTLPKFYRTALGRRPYRYSKGDGVFHLSNGSEIWLLGLDDAERVDKILGNEYATILFNECSQISYSSIETALTRLAQNCPGLRNKAYYDCNPPGKSHWSYKQFIKKLNPKENRVLDNPNDYAAMLMNPTDNIANLPVDYIDGLKSLSLRQRQRFLEGQFANDIEGSLWKQYWIDDLRVVSAPELKRIVVAIDPAVTSNEDSDETGLVVVGLGVDGDFYVLEDGTDKLEPLAWCNKAIQLYRKWNADRIIGEVNQGGDLICSLLKQVDRAVPYQAVRASHGKIARAEPIAALYEPGRVKGVRVHHVGVFERLEEQMTCYNPLTVKKSPDRMDALVWACTALLRGNGGGVILA